MSNIDSLKKQNEEHHTTIIQLENRLKEYETMDTQTMSEEDFSNIFQIKQQLKDTKETIEHNNPRNRSGLFSFKVIQFFASTP